MVKIDFPKSENLSGKSPLFHRTPTLSGCGIFSFSFRGIIDIIYPLFFITLIMGSIIKTNKTRKPFGFTLVELIVVITILVILGTIAFMQLGGFAGSARDSARIENLSNLHKGLSLFQIKSGTYPMPESPVNITASGTVIGYQGFAKDQVGSIAKLSPGGTRDPLDPTIYTTYSVNGDRTKMQLMAFLEDGSTVVSYIPTAYASAGSDYSKRFPIVKGDALGILLASGSLQPVQETSTGVDVVTTNTGYMAYFSTKNTIVGSGFILKSMRAGGELANGLIGYWSFDETGSTTVYDNSGNGNNGILSGTTLPNWIGGKVGGGVNIGPNQIIYGPLLSINPYVLGVSSIAKLGIIGSGMIIAEQTRGCQDGFTPYKGSSWAISVTNSGNIAVGFNKFGNHYHPNIGITSNMKITDLLYHFIAISFNYGKVQINLDNQKEIYDISSVDFGNPTVPLGTTGRIYNTSILSGMRANFYDYTGNDWKNYLDGSMKLSFDHFLKPEINITLGGQENLCGGVFSYQSSNGSLDEVRIYNRALSDSEIQTLYNATK